MVCALLGHLPASGSFRPVHLIRRFFHNSPKLALGKLQRQSCWTKRSLRLVCTTCSLAAASFALRFPRGFVGAGRGLNKRLSMTSCSATLGMDVVPPVAEKRPHVVEIGNVEGENRGDDSMVPPITLEDPYFWLRDDSRSNEEVLNHLRAENDYTKAKVAHLDVFRETLYTELRSHLQETDEDYPLLRGNFQYYRRTVEGLSYTIHCRRPKGGGEEEILLDENKLAEGKSFCSVEEVEPGPQHQFVAFTADFSGFETFDLYVRRLDGSFVEGNETPELKEVAGFAWGSEDETDVYYLTFDEAHRPFALWHHRLGSPQDQDERLFVEEDERFNLSVHRSRDGKFIFVSSDSTETSEVYYIDLGSRTSNALQCIRHRESGLRYSVDHRDGIFYIITNEGGQRNQVLRWCDVAGTSTPWKSLTSNDDLELLPHSEGRSLEAVLAFDSFLAIAGREDGLTQVWIIDKQHDIHRVDRPHESFWFEIESQTDFNSQTLRLSCSTLVMPTTTVDYHIVERRLENLRTKPVPNYDPSLYATRRLEARASDGTMIPMSLLWRRDLRTPPGEQGTNVTEALHLYAYGSYGLSVEPAFSKTRLPLVDRGIVYAIAHVRGGGEMGRWKWYEEGGKYLEKKNTFTDFISCAEHLVSEGWTVSSKLSVEGRSAGGLLIGASLNMRPDLFTAAVAGVPFVDVLVTMSDPSIPLTCGEWEEWGNPNEDEYFEYMKSYSPMENIKAASYPSVLITAGLHDPRVAYWEPAKYAQHLRERRTNSPDDGTEILLKMDMETGHFSASDRYKYLEETAFDQAWLLSKLGLGP